MSHLINIRTTQNVFIQYPLASLGDRMLAYLIDAVILTAYAIAVLLAFEYLNINTRWITIMIFVIPYLIYHLVFEILMDGQSPGKRLMKIKVIRLDGSSPTIGNYLMRWMFRLIEVLILRGAIAIVVIASSSRGQRLGDVVAGTTVVKLVKSEEATAHSVLTLVEDEYQPTFEQAINLSDRDIEVLQQALQLQQKTGNMHPAFAATDKVKSLLGLESNLSPIQFLTTIIKDFNYLTSR